MENYDKMLKFASESIRNSINNVEKEERIARLQGS